MIVQSAGGSPWPAYTATLGGGVLTWDGTALGWKGSQNDRQSLQTFSRKWKAAHNTIPSIVVSYSASLFQPGASFGSSTLPDGHYGHWGKVSTSTSVVGYTYSVGAAGGYSSVYLPKHIHVHYDPARIAPT